MNCDKAKEDIGALLDGELEVTQRDALERHLQICTECSKAKHLTLSLSNVLRASSAAEPSQQLRSRIKNSFQAHRPAEPAIWKRIAFARVLVPGPIFAMLLVLAAAGFWLSYQIGKINSSIVSMTAPPAEILNYVPTERKIETIFVEVPVVKEKTVVRIVRVGLPVRATKIKSSEPIQSRPDALPSFNSTTTAQGLSNDVNLKGFQPPAEMNARVIKEENKNEK